MLFVHVQFKGQFVWVRVYCLHFKDVLYIPNRHFAVNVKALLHKEKFTELYFGCQWYANWGTCLVHLVNIYNMQFLFYFCFLFFSGTWMFCTLPSPSVVSLPHCVVLVLGLPILHVSWLNSDSKSYRNVLCIMYFIIHSNQQYVYKRDGYLQCVVQNLSFAFLLSTFLA